MKKQLKSCVMALALVLPVVAAAETVVIPVGKQAVEKQSLERPNRGISKNQVENQFGEPLSRHGPVGDPPISSWEYNEFTVYFEYDHVLHSVLKTSAKVPE